MAKPAVCFTDDGLVPRREILLGRLLGVGGVLFTETDSGLQLVCGRWFILGNVVSLGLSGVVKGGLTDVGGAEEFLSARGKEEKKKERKKGRGGKELTSGRECARENDHRRGRLEPDHGSFRELEPSEDRQQSRGSCRYERARQHRCQLAARSW